MSEVRVGTGFICYRYRLDAGKDGWTRHVWCVVWPGLLQRSGFSDDVCLLAELLELLIPVLETMAFEATSLGFEYVGRKQRFKLWTPG